MTLFNIWRRRRWSAHAQADKGVIRILMGLPMGRLLTPEDMVGPALFLASDDSSFVNGVELSVDGGFSAI